MPAPSDRNARIALAKGWVWRAKARICHYSGGYLDEIEASYWSDSKGRSMPLPNFVGTLEGVAGLMWELGPAWSVRRFQNQWMCYHTFGPLVLAESFLSDKLGGCVGDAYLSVFGKEATDAS